MAKGSKKKKNPNEVAYFKRYTIENRYAKNRASDLEKHVDKFPNDEQATKRLNESGTFEYRRNTHGKSVVNKDTKDKYRLQMYIHTKHYPPQKKVSFNTAFKGLGKTLKEQLSEIRGLVYA